jgi:Na+-driven multidrug efflux pump
MKPKNFKTIKKAQIELLRLFMPLFIENYMQNLYEKDRFPAI